MKFFGNTVRSFRDRVSGCSSTTKNRGSYSVQRKPTNTRKTKKYILDHCLSAHASADGKASVSGLSGEENCAKTIVDPAPHGGVTRKKSSSSESLRFKPSHRSQKRENGVVSVPATAKSRKELIESLGAKREGCLDEVQRLKVSSSLRMGSIDSPATMVDDLLHVLDLVLHNWHNVRRYSVEEYIEDLDGVIDVLARLEGLSPSERKGWGGMEKIIECRKTLASLRSEIKGTRVLKEECPEELKPLLVAASNSLHTIESLIKSNAKKRSGKWLVSQQEESDCTTGRLLTEAARLLGRSGDFQRSDTESSSVYDKGQTVTVADKPLNSHSIGDEQKHARGKLKKSKPKAGKLGVRRRRDSKPSDAFGKKSLTTENDNEGFSTPHVTYINNLKGDVRASPVEQLKFDLGTANIIILQWIDKNIGFWGSDQKMNECENFSSAVKGLFNRLSKYKSDTARILNSSDFEGFSDLKIQANLMKEWAKSAKVEAKEMKDRIDYIFFEENYSEETWKQDVGQFVNLLNKVRDGALKFQQGELHPIASVHV